MIPFLRPGDRILIQPTASLRPGDLITFLKGSDLCTHRLIRRIKRAGKTFLLTKGDLCARLDPPVLEEAVVGKGVAIRRGHKVIALESAAWPVLNRALLLLSLGMGWLLWIKWKFSI